MTNGERTLKAALIELYCDADNRGRIEPEKAEKYCPTLEEAMLWAWPE